MANANFVKRCTLSPGTLFRFSRTRGKSLSDFRNLDAANIVSRIQPEGLNCRLLHGQANRVSSGRLGRPVMGPESPRIIRNLVEVVYRHVIFFRIEADLQDLHRLEASPGDSHNAIPDLAGKIRSEEHTSELQSRFDLVCRLLLEKKKKKKNNKLQYYKQNK